MYDDMELPIVRTRVAGPAANALALRKEVGTPIQETVNWMAYEQIKLAIMEGLRTLIAKETDDGQ